MPLEVLTLVSKGGEGGRHKADPIVTIDCARFKQFAPAPVLHTERTKRIHFVTAVASLASRKELSSTAAVKSTDRSSGQ